MLRLMLDTPLMLWELSVTEQSYRAVLEVLAGVPVTEVAGRYGVSRQSVHAWLRRYRSEGPRVWRTAAIKCRRSSSVGTAKVGYCQPLEYWPAVSRKYW